MRPLPRLFLALRSFSALAVLSGSAAAFADAGERAFEANDVPDCVDVQAVSRQNGIGFSHAVIVTNHCSVAVRCELATDVDPSPTQSLRVLPNQTGEIATRVASPAPAVSAIATCRLEGGR